MNRLLRVLAVLVLVTACDAVGESFPTETTPSPWTGPSDWPGPLRVEPAEGAATVTMDELPPGVADSEPSRTFTDGIGDIGEGAPGWLDITTINVQNPGTDSGSVHVYFDLADDLPLPIPGRIAYGLVVDVDGDGTADARFGIDNISDKEHRVWRTDLATGETEHAEGPPYGAVADTWYPSQHDRDIGGIFLISGLPGETEFRFYLWASQRLGSQVIATDYAPDNGWIDRPEADR